MTILPATSLRNPYMVNTTPTTPNSQNTYNLSQSTNSINSTPEPTVTTMTNIHFHTKNTLTSWLTTACCSKQPCNHKGHNLQAANSTPSAPLQKKHTGQQTTLHIPDKSNEHWGDIPHSSNTTPCLWVVGRNVNTLNTKQNYLSWRATTQAALHIQADILCLQETNTNWSHNTNTNIKSIFNNTPYRQCKIATSASNNQTLLPYKPGSLPH